MPSVGGLACWGSRFHPRQVSMCKFFLPCFLILLPKRVVNNTVTISLDMQPNHTSRYPRPSSARRGRGTPASRSCQLTCRIFAGTTHADPIRTTRCWCARMSIQKAASRRMQSTTAQSQPSGTLFALWSGSWKRASCNILTNIIHLRENVEKISGNSDNSNI